MKSRQKILIVDDKPENIYTLERVLKETGCEIIAALNGNDALIASLNHDLALAILDVQMPEMDGYEVARFLRDDEKTCCLPIIFLSAVYSDDYHVFKGYETGAVDFITKPYDPRLLLSKVKVYLKLDRQSRERSEHLARARTLLEVSSKILAETSLEGMLRRVAAAARILTGARCGEALHGYRNGAFEVIAGSHIEEAGEARMHAIPDGQIYEEIRKRGAATCLSGEALGQSPGGLLAAPLMGTGGEPSGLVMVSGKGGEFSSEDETALAQLAALASLGLSHIEARARLEERVQERTAELSRANVDLTTHASRLEMLNQELQDFAFVASHDLQEPLRKIQAFSTMLTKKCTSWLDDDSKDYLSRINRAAGRMQSLLSALLEYSRVVTRANPFIPLDLTAVTREVLEDLDYVVDMVGGSIDIGELPCVEADEIQMRQLLQNLLSNSLKYHNEQEQPLIRIYGEANGTLCRIYVEDNGIGFNEKYLDRIFKPFQRLHSRSRYEGIGMGLAICRKIVDRHSGTISARSTPGRGATFMVVLPLRQS